MAKQYHISYRRRRSGGRHRGRLQQRNKNELGSEGENFMVAEAERAVCFGGDQDLYGVLVQVFFSCTPAGYNPCSQGKTGRQRVMDLSAR